jgi:hypothetical protein
VVPNTDLSRLKRDRKPTKSAGNGSRKPYGSSGDPFRCRKFRGGSAHQMGWVGKSPVVAARECGRLHALVAQRGGAPRRRALDLAIAATANIHGVPLLTHNTKDFQIIADKIDLRQA